MKYLIFIYSLLVFCTPAHAWERRGHSIICQTAAYLAAGEPKASYLKSQSFALEYYCNAPDFIWKKPATYKLERDNHYMDIEIFERHVPAPDREKAYQLDRKAFDTKYPQVPQSAGRAWWRIREMHEKLVSLQTRVAAADLEKDNRPRIQLDWLIHAGAIGHYVGDLANPMHNSENYDGQLTGQPGLHSFWEGALVDELLHLETVNLTTEVWTTSQKRWRHDKAALAKKTTLEIAQALSRESFAKLGEVLKLDKKIPRTRLKEAARAHRRIIVERLAAGSVALAELYRRGAVLNFDEEKFYEWEPAPAFIAP